MIRSFLIIAWRNLLKNKLYSFINITGLAVGIGCCVMIYMYMHRELSYDSFNGKEKDIYRLTLHVHQPQGDIESAATAPLMGPLIQQNFPEILKTVRIGGLLEKYLGYKSKKIFDNKIVLADSTFFDVFPFPLKEGNAATALSDPYKIVLTESMARKYFGNEPALGKVMDYGANKNVTVSAIMKDIPDNYHFKCDALVSRSTSLAMNDSIWIREKEYNWYWIFQYTYFVLDKKADIKSLESKISALTAAQYPERKKESGIWYEGKLQPLKDIHLHSAMDREFMPNSDIKYVYIFSVTALLILLVACFNFVNLSTARSIQRSKEIGLRKTVGASRGQLIIQFLGESFLFTLIAAALASALIYCFLPLFSSLSETPVKPGMELIPVYVVIILGVGLLAGLYPAFLISSFNPVKSLKGSIKYSWQDIFFRKGLVVFQFCIAVFLIVGTQVILEQLHFIQNKKTGLHKEQMLQLKFRRSEKSQQDAFLQQLRSNPEIVNVSLNSFSFKETQSIPLMLMDDEQRGYNAYPVVLIDENFLNTFQLSLVEGRNISKNFPQDEKESFLINETAVKAFGWKTSKEAIGKRINWGGVKQGSVVGVVKDFNYTSLHEEIKPLILHPFPFVYSMTMRVKSNDLPATIAGLEKQWKVIFPEVPFQYSFMQDDFEHMYKSEQKLASVLGVFTSLSIFVACLGLFGLAAYSLKQRVKEIGIRKILGATLPGIISLLSKDFIKLVLLALVIASPIAWYASNKWLQDFAYKINVSPVTFALAGILIFLITLATVAGQALKTASANPVKSLRTE
jgi:putative ABC transport system permease protein